MISNKLIAEHAKKCKQFISMKQNAPSKASLKDLELLIRCKANSDFAPMFTTVLYCKQRGEYPLAILYLDTITEQDLNGTCQCILNIKLVTTNYEKINNRWHVARESCTYIDSLKADEYVRANSGKSKIKDGSKRSVKYDNTRFGKRAVQVEVICSINGVLTKTVGVLDYSNAREYYPQQPVMKRGGHQYV